jgi:hypothetical protein
MRPSEFVGSSPIDDQGFTTQDTSGHTRRNGESESTSPENTTGTVAGVAANVQYRSLHCDLKVSNTWNGGRRKEGRKRKCRNEGKGWERGKGERKNQGRAGRKDKSGKGK